MPIKITCPHCKRAMIVDERLAGKKGRCKACQQILTVPSRGTSPATTSPTSGAEQPKPAASPKAQTPPPSPADVEAEAAALFSDEPASAEKTETKTIDLNCPMCDEAIHFPVDLAGKRAPCPECRNIIKVPELTTKDPKDWRKTTEQRGPSGARRPEQPTLEGAWGSAKAGSVGKDALIKAGVIAAKREPLTRWQKIRWPVLGATVLLVLLAGGWGGYRWWGDRAADRAFKAALTYAASGEAAKEAGPTGQAALALGAGEYYLRSHREKPAVDAAGQFSKAFTLLRDAPASEDRDILLTELALAEIELGGNEADANKEIRLLWSKTQPLLLTTLQQIHDPEARRQAVRVVSERLIERGQTARVFQVVSQMYTTPDAERAAALSIAGLVLLKANDRTAAEKAAAEALTLYEGAKPPPLRAEVVALAQAVKGKSPKPSDKPEDKRNDYIGQIEALARTDKGDQARQQAGKTEYGDVGQFSALLVLAAAAADSKATDTSDVEKAIALADAKLREKPELSWSLLRLTHLAIRAGVAEERLQTLADCIATPSLRGWAQLAIFRARLAQTKQPIEDNAADKIDPAGSARSLASQALARHNTRLHSSWPQAIQGWQQPLQAFGSLGVALGLQDRGR
jgi:hypothetical protein